MHEAMVAQSLLAAISSEAQKHNAKPIGAAVSCGTLYAVNDETLCFAFEALAKGTPCEQVKLDFTHVPLQARCRKCEKQFDVEIMAPACPACKSEDFELLPDAPLMLDEIEFETE